MGDVPFYLKFWVKVTALERNRLFSIFSLVATQPNVHTNFITDVSFLQVIQDPDADFGFGPNPPWRRSAPSECIRCFRFFFVSVTITVDLNNTVIPFDVCRFRRLPIVCLWISGQISARTVVGGVMILVFASHVFVATGIVQNSKHLQFFLNRRPFSQLFLYEVYKLCMLLRYRFKRHNLLRSDMCFI